jgi:hypothetical protein
MRLVEMKIPIKGSVYIEVKVCGNWLSLQKDDREFLSKCVDGFRGIAAEALGRESMRLTTESLEEKLGLVEPKVPEPRFEDKSE